MKRFALLVLTITMVCSIDSFSFYKIAVQKGDVVKFYTDIQMAVDSAATGSDIYLPGTQYNSVNITKKLNFYGTGHYPSETAATGITYIATIYIKSGADSSTFSGISAGNLTSQANSKYMVFKRCKLPNVDGYYSMTNVSFSETLLGIFYTSLNQCYIEKCIFQSVSGNYTFISSVRSCIMTNNISNTQYIFSDGSGNIIKNSIFTYSVAYFGTGNDYENNLFVANITDFGNNTANNNLVNKALSNIFVSVSSALDFSYSYDYHLKSDSPGKNHSTDGTDNGIYGTNIPYKENAVPVNPHITKSIISQQSVNGLLPVEIQVEAQTK